MKKNEKDKHSSITILNIFLLLFFISFIRSWVILGIVAFFVISYSIYKRKKINIFPLLTPVLPFILLMAIPPFIRYFINKDSSDLSFYLMMISKVGLSSIALGTVVDLHSALYLVDGLLNLGLPSFFNRILSLTFRYFHMIHQDVKKGNRALISRGILERRGLSAVQIFGEWIGGFFLKSSTHGERVYTAMVSRGFQGESHSGLSLKKELILRLIIYIFLITIILQIDGKMKYGM
ncbi:MAG: energy-coupling factor transporter transmembrane component T [Tissierellia bacterium]|nr:energy-coupling factor transporter transmembrane component T [Tissierellia bacterium]